MINSSLDNVQFSVYTTSFNEDIGMDVLADTPTISNLQGHLQEFYFTPESTIEGIHERDRATRWRLNLKGSTQIDSAVTLGSFINITAKKHKDTNGWYSVDGTEQYIVSYINETNATGRWLTVGLRRKDQGD